MTTNTLLVTGASGHLARRVLDHLVQRGAAKDGRLIATTRNPEKLKDLAARGVDVRKADFDDLAATTAAFRGAQRVLVVSTDALDRPGHRAEQHAVAIEAAKAAGVKHIVYTSVTKAKDSGLPVAFDHKLTEEALEKSGLDFTVVRNNWYSENLLASLPNAVKSGKLFTAAGEGRIAYATRDDCAAVAAAALASSFSGKRTIELSGPDAVSPADVARIASEVTGKPIEVVHVTPEQLVDGLVKAGVPQGYAQFFAAVDVEVKKGALDLVTNTVREVADRAPTTLRAFLEAHKAALLG
jgi:NAD(P)H dehydrogenase (quinone)